MKIKKLSSKVYSSLRTSTIITDTIQCVVELVQNALDAQSTSIAVRVDLEAFMIQVVDNGHGLTKDQLDLIGTRYMTSKCHSLKDLKSNIKYYGFRGESLASLRECCNALMIVSKSKDCDQTYSKVFRGTKESHGASVSVHNRLCVGTTVIVKEFLITMPVRRARIQPAIEMEEIRHALLALSIIHYKVSFTLRNDTNKVVILQTHEFDSTSEALQHHCNLNKDLCLVPVTSSVSPFTVLAHISRETEQTNHFQFIYVNKRLIKNKNMYKLVNKALLKSFYLRNTGKEIRVSNDKPRKRSFPVFVISIKCPYMEYDISSDPRKLTVEFRDWNPVIKSLEKVCMKFVSSEGMLKTSTNTDCSKENILSNERMLSSHKNVDMQGLPIESNILLGVPAMRKRYNQKQTVNTKRTNNSQTKSKSKHKMTVVSTHISNDGNNLDLNMNMSSLVTCKGNTKEKKSINSINKSNVSFQCNLKSGLGSTIKVSNTNLIQHDEKITTYNSKESFNAEFISNSDLENPFPFKVPNQKHFARKRKWLSEHVVTESESGVSPVKIKPIWDSESLEIVTLSKKSILPITCQEFFCDEMRAMSLTRNLLLNNPKVNSFQTPDHNLKINIYQSITNFNNDLSLEVTRKNTYEYSIQNDGYYFNCSKDTFSTLVITKKGGNEIHNSEFQNSQNDKSLQNIKEQHAEKISNIPKRLILCKTNNKTNLKQNWHIFSPSFRTCKNQRYKPLAIEKSNCQNNLLNGKGKNLLSGKRTVSKISPVKNPLPQKRNDCVLLNFKKPAYCDLKSKLTTINKNKSKTHEVFINGAETVLKPEEKIKCNFNPRLSNLIRKAKRNNANSQQSKTTRKLNAGKSTVDLKSNSNLKMTFVFSRSQNTNIGKIAHTEYPCIGANLNKNTKCDILGEKSPKNRDIPSKFNATIVENLETATQRKEISQEFRYNLKKEHQKTKSTINKTINAIEHDKEINFKSTKNRYNTQPVIKNKSRHKEFEINNTKNVTPFHIEGTQKAYFTSQMKCKTKNNNHQALPSWEANIHETTPISSNCFLNVDIKPRVEFIGTINNHPSTLKVKKSNETGIHKSYINEYTKRNQVPEILKLIDCGDRNMKKSHVKDLQYYLENTCDEVNLNGDEKQQLFFDQINKSATSEYTKSKRNPIPEIIKLIGVDTIVKTSHFGNLPLENTCNDICSNGGEKQQPIMDKVIDNQNSVYLSPIIMPNENDVANMNRPSQKCIEPSKNDHIWRKEAIPNGKTIYINPLTGMSTYLTPKHDFKESYVINNRYWFMTKGTSPLLSINDSKCNNATEAQKNIVKQIVEPNLTAELETIKWKHNSQKGVETVLNLLGSNSMDKQWNPRFNFNSSCVFSTESLKTAKVLGQIDNKFIAALLRPNEKTNWFLILFDQHAVDERIRLETLTVGYKKNDGQLISHSVNPSLEVVFTENEQSIVNELRQRISKLGLMFTTDKDKILVNAVPLCLYNRALREKNEGILTLMVTALLRELISIAEAVRGVMPTMPPSLSDIINSEACRGAIKFGDELTVEECKLLLSKLSDCETPFQCAHGRPVLTPLIEIKESFTEGKKINLKRLIKRREARLKNEEIDVRRKIL